MSWYWQLQDSSGCSWHLQEQKSCLLLKNPYQSSIWVNHNTLVFLALLGKMLTCFASAYIPLASFFDWLQLIIDDLYKKSCTWQSSFVGFSFKLTTSLIHLFGPFQIVSKSRRVTDMSSFWHNSSDSSNVLLTTALISNSVSREKVSCFFFELSSSMPLSFSKSRCFWNSALAENSVHWQ